MGIEEHQRRTSGRPELLPYVADSVGTILGEKSIERQLSLIEDLRIRIERDYCAKKGVRDDDVAYCAFAQTGLCGYLNALKRVHSEFGVNLITGEVKHADRH